MRLSTVAPRVLREAIGVFLRDRLKSDDVEEFCVEIGLAPPDSPEATAFTSRRAYVGRRLGGKSVAELVDIAVRVDEELDAPELRELIAKIGSAGVPGLPKNLIFAADGPKHRIVLSDAINNDIKIIKNEQYCLVYDRPIGLDGLTWGDLAAWWSDREQLSHLNERQLSSSLHKRLLDSLVNDAERMILDRYAHLHVARTSAMPALLPQVHLHYDPYARGQPGSVPGVARQRMDFLLLLANRVRVVIELDGVQHYADAAGRADSRRYAAMVAEDRQLRLRGYEVYRIGGHELMDRPSGEAMLDEFFEHLSTRYSV